MTLQLDFRKSFSFSPLLFTDPIYHSPPTFTDDAVFSLFRAFPLSLPPPNFCAAAVTSKCCAMIGGNVRHLGAMPDGPPE